MQAMDKEIDRARPYHCRGDGKRPGGSRQSRLAPEPDSCQGQYEGRRHRQLREQEFDEVTQREMSFRNTAELEFERDPAMGGVPIEIGRKKCGSKDAAEIGPRCSQPETA